MLLQALCIIILPLANSNWSYRPETPNLGQFQRLVEPGDLEIWWMTLKKRVPLINNIELFASFHNHMWVRTGVTVRKRLSWVLTSVTFAFDLWPWTFAWPSLWSLVMTPENDGSIVKKLWRTDRRTESTIHRAAWSQLRTNWIYNTCFALYFSLPCFF